MTLIIAHSSPTHAFLAADSCRWDHIYQAKLAPVQKLHIANQKSAVAIGGSCIDRSMLAKQMVELRNRGTTFEDAARSVSPALFRETAAKMRIQGFSGPQFFFAWYAECKDGVCEIRRHEMPDDRVFMTAGLDVRGPNSEWIRDVAEERLTLMKDEQDFVYLDHWAKKVFQLAQESDPTKVSLPAAVAMIRPDRSIVTLQLMDDLSVPRSQDFRAKI